MKIEEKFIVAAPLEQVWAFIRDPAKVGPCLPGCDGVEAIGPTTYRATVTVAFGPIKPRFALLVELTEERPPHFAATETRGEEGGNASRLSAKSTLSLSPLPDGATEVHYCSEVSVVGRLATYGMGLMKKKAKTLGEEFARNVRAALETEPSAADGLAPSPMRQ